MIEHMFAERSFDRDSIDSSAHRPMPPMIADDDSLQPKPHTTLSIDADSIDVPADDVRTSSLSRVKREPVQSEQFLLAPHPDPNASAETAGIFYETLCCIGGRVFSIPPPAKRLQQLGQSKPNRSRGSTSSAR